MEIIFDKQTNVDGILKICIGFDDYHKKVEVEIKKYAQKANIKGFRPGKVPTDYIKKLHGKAFLANVVTELVGKEIKKYIEDNKIKVLGTPIPEEKNNVIDWENQTEFCFTYNVGLIDNEDLKMDKSVTITKYDFVIEESDLDYEIETLRNQYTEYTAQNAIEENSVMRGKLLYEDKIYPTLYFDYHILERSALEPIQGKKINDIVELQLSKPEKAEVLIAMVGKYVDAFSFPLELKLKIEKIGIPKKPELNETFFKRLFPNEKEIDQTRFRELMKENIEKTFKSSYKSTFLRELEEEYMKKIKLQLPEDFLKRFFKYSDEKVTDEYIDENFDKMLNGVKWDIIKKTIIENNNVEIKREDVESHTISKLKEQFGETFNESPEGEVFKNYAYEHLYKDSKMENYYKMYDEVMNKRVYDYIENLANIKTTKMSWTKYVERRKKIMRTK